MAEPPPEYTEATVTGDDALAAEMAAEATAKRNQIAKAIEMEKQRNVRTSPRG